MAACSALGLLVAFVGTAREALRHRDRITVTSDAIIFKRWSDGRETTFRRVDGDLLLIFPKDFLYASAIDFSLTQLGTGRQFGLITFPVGPSGGRAAGAAGGSATIPAWVSGT
jgi:hypothetical protein